MLVKFENRRKLFRADFTFEAFDVAHFLVLVLVTDWDELLVAVGTFQMPLVEVKSEVFFEAERDRTVAAEIALLELVFVDFVVES